MGSDVVTLLQGILSDEAIGNVQPVNAYMLQTLKAFVQHVKATVAPKRSGNRVGEDIGDIKRTAEIEHRGEVYTIVQRDSSQIQLIKDGEKVVARPILVDYIADNNVPSRDTPTHTTRTLGRDILNWLEAQA